MTLSQNAAAYCSRPRLFSHSPTSTAVSSRPVMLAPDYCVRNRFCRGKETSFRPCRFGPLGGNETNRVVSSGPPSRRPRKGGLTTGPRRLALALLGMGPLVGEISPSYELPRALSPDQD